MLLLFHHPRASFLYTKRVTWVTDAADSSSLFLSVSLFPEGRSFFLSLPSLSLQIERQEKGYIGNEWAEDREKERRSK